MTDRKETTTDQDPRVKAALADYFDRIDRGEPVDRDRFLAEHKDIANDLRSFLATEQEVAQLADPAGDKPAAGSPDVSTQSVAEKGEETIIPERVRKETGPTGSGTLPPEFGRYRVLKPLGSGAMGTVYLAEDTQLERRVALKTPSFDGDNTEELLERFYREARSAATLRHPNICPVFDVGEIDGTHYISMAYIEGRPLSAYIQPDHLPSERNTLLIVRKIALGLHEAHQHGIIHRDLKPGNVMIDEKGEPIVMDFGLARKASSGGEARLTQSGTIVGSPAYMSPEQVEGDSDQLTPAADQYSLGVMLYELLTGELPFRGSITAVIGAILTKQPTPVAELRSDLDPRIVALCERMMHKEAGKRFASLREVANEIRGILSQAGGGQVTGEAKPQAGGAKPQAGERKKKKTTKAAAASITASNVSSLYEAAQKCMRKHDYEQVVQLLEKLPERKRTDEVDKLLARARQLADEVAFLIAEIEEAERLNDNEALAVKVDELLKLKHRRARQIKEELSRYGKGRLWKAGGWTPDGRRIGEGSWIPWIGVAVALVAFGLTLWAVTVYLKGNDKLVKIEIDEMLLENGEVTLHIDGDTVTIDGIGETINLEPGEYDWQLTRGDQQIIGLREFVVQEEGSNVLRITIDDAPIAAQQITDTRTPLPDGPPGEVVRLESHTHLMTALAVSPDGQMLVTGAQRGSPLVWDLGAQEVSHEIDTTRASYGFLFIRDGRELICAGTAGAVEKFDSRTGEKLLTYEGHAEDGPAKSDSVIFLGLARNAQHFVTAAWTGKIRVWNFDAPVSTREVDAGSGGYLFYAAVSREGFIVSEPGDVRLISANDGSLIRTFDVPHRGEIEVSPDATKMLLAKGTEAAVVNIGTGDVVNSWSVHPRVAAARTFSPDGRHVAIFSEQNWLHIYNTASGDEIYSAEMPGRGHRCVFTPDGRFLAFVCRSKDEGAPVDTNVYIWRLPRVVWTEFSPTSTDETAPVSADQRIELFNGHDFTGWEIADNPDAWKVVDGTIVAEGPGQGWLISDQDFSDFELSLEYRVEPGADSGVSLRVPADKNRMSESIEVQVRDNENLPDRAQRFPRFQNGALVDLVGPTDDPAHTDDQWNTLFIRAEGRRLSVDLNGQRIQNVDLDHLLRSKPDHAGLQRVSGRIALQHWSPARVEFRNIRILPLEPPDGPGDEPNSSGGVVPFPENAAFTNARSLDELNKPGVVDAYPWISPDGLTLYWTREGRGEVSSILQASRPSPSEPFRGEFTIVKDARIASLSPDSLEIVCLFDADGDGKNDELGSSRRPGDDVAFPRPREIESLKEVPLPKGTAISSDGLSLIVLQSSNGSAKHPRSILVCQRDDPADDWGPARPVTVTGQLPADSWLTHPSLDVSGEHLLFSFSEPGSRYLEWGGVADSTDDPLVFENSRPLLLDGERFITRGGRYCAATGELFYTHPIGPRPYQEMQLRVARAIE